MNTKLVKIIIIFAFLILYAFFNASTPILAYSGTAEPSAILSSFEAQKTDQRIVQLREFLAHYNSPLEPFAADFVTIADKYGVDWKLVPAISGVESTFGKFIPYGSYNAYGWANGNFYFQSWPDSIEIVNKTLREKYIDRGADTVEKIASIYAPPSRTWARNVLYFIDKIESFDTSYSEPYQLPLSL